MPLNSNPFRSNRVTPSVRRQIEALWEAIEELTVSAGVTSVNGDSGPAVVLDADNISDAATTNKFATADQLTKVDSVETGATADQTDTEIATAYQNEVAFASQAEMESGTPSSSERRMSPERVKQAIDAHAGGSAAVTSVNTQTGAVVLDPDDLDDTSTTNKFTTASDISKLAGIESGATGDQTNEEIRIAYQTEVPTASAAEMEAAVPINVPRVMTPLLIKLAIDEHAPGTVTSVNSQTGDVVLTGGQINDDFSSVGLEATNVTNAILELYTFLIGPNTTKLAGIESGATADQTGAEIKAAYEAEADTNAFTDAEQTKLAGIETAATADQSDAEIEAAYNNQVDVATQAAMEAGTSTTVVRVTPELIKHAIVALAPDGAGVTTTGSITGGYYSRFSGADTIEARSPAQVRSDLNVADGADVTNAANVLNALSGASIDEVTPSSSDKFLMQDASNSGNVRVVSYGNMASGSGSAVYPGVLLESFSGANDDAKLTAAMSYAASQTYKPAILLYENRVYNFTQAGRTLYSGFKLQGANYSEQVRSSNPSPQKIDVDVGTATWLTLPSSGNYYGISMRNLSIEGGSTSVMIETPGSSNLWLSEFHNLGITNFRHVFGKPGTRQFVMTGGHFSGLWNVNNCTDCAFYLAGSDCRFWTDGYCLLDSPRSISSVSGNFNYPYHIWFDYQEKSRIGPMFITAEDKPAAMRITGASTQGDLTFRDIHMEGRNADNSSWGSVLRVEGAYAIKFVDCWISYGFSELGSTGRSGEGGVITVMNGARTQFRGCTYSRAGTDGVTESDPWLYVTGSGSRARVSDLEVVHDGGSFTGVPRYATASGGSVINTDSTIQSV